MDGYAYPHEPWVLAVDAVSACCALALAQGHWLRGVFYSHSPLTLSQRLLPALQTLLQNVECPLDRIRLVGLNRGPGSFTALRIMLATLMGLRVRVPFRVLASDTLTLQVLRWSGQGEVWSLIPAGRTEFALALFTKEGDRVVRQTEVRHGTWYQVYPTLQGDDRPVLYPEPGVIPMAGSPRVIRIHERHRVEALLALAQRPGAFQEAVEIYEVQPYYLRPPDIRRVETFIPSGPGRPPGPAEE
ncbi:MAG: tRNA (adenosine(37)-N6)-threonylcarbamoyltransferase complex dimerization subunit type 1 TsaB [Acidobacteria bacterium]|nr:tRNA (adenosine(37)-N6)-threonylcarbamoyltransferase complex dimerization subunit type 1 TsaB [Acidobacteriota bacterium]MDW7985361.1 tRNA (adenosine(37)-N6)-threonylcarbamoyltransferase complex dimerization subunit type 1 TsaB [Acidobacteriota bacterium]